MDDTTEAVESARETVVGAFERAAQIWGGKRSHGRLYGLLFFAEEPRSLDQLVADSGYAKSTVSTAMTTLERYHLVQRRSIPGEGKRAYFEAETDFWYVFRQFLEGEVRREISTMTRALDEAAETLEDAESEQAAHDLERVRKLQRLYDRSDRLVSVLTSQPLERLTAVFDRLGDEE